MRSPADRRRESEKQKAPCLCGETHCTSALVRPSRGTLSAARLDCVPQLRLFLSENTIDAFNYAVCSGCDGFEFDVRFTSDRHSVLCHDPKLNRKEVATTNVF